MNIQTYPVWTALITPLNEDRSIDFHSLDRLIDEQMAANLGLLLLGSTAESLNLKLEDRKRIVLHCLEQKISTPIMVGVLGHDLSACQDWLAFLEDLPIHAYLMITPIYARPGDEGQYHWFKTLMDRVSRPVMIYNVPKRVGVELSLSAVERLSDHKNYWAIKDASGSKEKCHSYIKASQNRPVYCGDDGLFHQFAQAGSCGLISVASNVWPKAIYHFGRQCLENRLNSHELWQSAFLQLFSVTNPVAVKRILFEEGRIAHKTLMPPLSEFDLLQCDELIAASLRVHDWGALAEKHEE
jgi:4-hydroxy-tetrahydrodipicolinate synthase